MNLEQMQMIIEQIRELSEPERGPFIAWLIVELIAKVTFYIVLGLVVWSLGRRMIQAGVMAWKESRSERV